MSWKHATTLSIADALTALKQPAITLSVPVATVLFTAAPQVVQVWFEPDPAASTAASLAAPAAIFTIHGTTSFNAAGMLWTRRDDDQSATRVLAVGGRILIRIHCGHLVSADNRNFSAALDCVTQQASPHVPGGIFESWFFVKVG